MTPFTVLAHESQSEFDHLLATLDSEHSPAGTHQQFLVEQMAVARWQLARARRLETLALDLIVLDETNSNDPDARIVRQLEKSSRDALSTLARLAAQAEHAYYKAFQELTAARKIQNEAKLVANLDANLLRRVVTAPPPSGRTQQNQPKPPKSAPAMPLRAQMPANLALCL